MIGRLRQPGASNVRGAKVLSTSRPGYGGCFAGAHRGVCSIILTCESSRARPALAGARRHPHTTHEVVRLTADAVPEPAAPPDPAPGAADSGPGQPGSQARPKVFLHIGEPKTGTTFLQQVMWRNRAELAARGV